MIQLRFRKVGGANIELVRLRDCLFSKSGTAFSALYGHPPLDGLPAEGFGLSRKGGESTLRIHEKGGKRRTIGIQYGAARAIVEHIEKEGLIQGDRVVGQLGEKAGTIRGA